MSLTAHDQALVQPFLDAWGASAVWQAKGSPTRTPVTVMPEQVAAERLEYAPGEVERAELLLHVPVAVIPAPAAGDVCEIASAAGTTYAGRWVVTGPPQRRDAGMAVVPVVAETALRSRQPGLRRLPS